MAAINQIYFLPREPLLPSSLPFAVDIVVIDKSEYDHLSVSVKSYRNDQPSASQPIRGQDRGLRPMRGRGSGPLSGLMFRQESSLKTQLGSDDGRPLLIF